MRALPFPMGEVPPEGSGGGHVGPTGLLARTYFPLGAQKPSPERGRWPEGPDEVASQPSPDSQGKAFFVLQGNSSQLPMPVFQNLYNLTKKSLQFPGFTGIIYVTGMQAKNRTSGNDQPEEGKVTL